MASREGVSYTNYSGGPHGLGDPNNKSLRKAELNVLIPKKMREEAGKKCFKEYEGNDIYCVLCKNSTSQLMIEITKKL